MKDVKSLWKRCMHYTKMLGKTDEEVSIKRKRSYLSRFYLDCKLMAHSLGVAEQDVYLAFSMTDSFNDFINFSKI